MNLSRIFHQSLQAIKSNAPEILTALSISGVVTTAYLTGKASYEASVIIHDNESVGGTHGDRKERFKERAKHTWRLYVPAGISGAVTVGCIIASSRGAGKRTAAAVTAYSVTERAFSEYREKVVEQIGKNKEQAIRDEIAQDHILQNPQVKEIIVTGTGQVLCCELFTHRYFRSDMEQLRKAQNDINAKIVNGYYVSLDQFYDLIGLPYTSTSGNLGWDSNKLMELHFSTVLSEHDEPCLAFDYNYTKPLR